MKGFWRHLLKKELGARWLEGLRYAVFGLGDSGYQKYNFTAKKIDRRILHLGAEPIIEIGLGDDQHPSGYVGALDPWLMSLWRSLNQANLPLLPRLSDISDPNLNNLGDPKVEVVYYSHDDAPHDSIASGSKNLIERARSMSPALKFHNDGEPQYMLKMIRAKGRDEVSKCSLVNGMMDRIKLNTFVALTMDVASASPRRYFFEIMSYFATAEHLD